MIGDSRLQRSHTRLEHFLLALKAMDESSWRRVLSTPVPTAHLEEARRLVRAVLASDPQFRGPLRDDAQYASGVIDALSADPQFHRIAGKLGGGEGPERLRQLACDAASALLVLSAPNLPVRSEGLTFSSAAVVLYGPFEEVIPLISL